MSAGDLHRLLTTGAATGRFLVSNDVKDIDDGPALNTEDFSNIILEARLFTPQTEADPFSFWLI